MTAFYRVLAQKYRPSCLDEIIGQETLVQTLKNALQSNKIPQAFIFTGVRGTGKTSAARILALSLNCLKESEESQIGALKTGTLSPCGQCSACLAIKEGRHIDVIEMDAASHTGVDDIREIIEASRYRPLQAAYKIYIIDEAHMLSKSAFNALLKTLEEPPAHVKFILATTEIRKVPLTVLSRCMRFDLQRIPVNLLADFYKKISLIEKVVIEDAAVRLIAEMAEGSVRDGLSILEQALHLSTEKIEEEAVRRMVGRAQNQNLEKLFDQLLQGKIPEALKEARQLYQEGVEAESLLQSLLECVHRTSLYKIGNGDSQEDSFLKSIAPSLSLAVLTRFWQILLKGLEEVTRSPSAFMALEMILIRLGYVKTLPPLESKEDEELLKKDQPKEIKPVPQNVLSSKVEIETPAAPQKNRIEKATEKASPLLNTFEELVKFVAEHREPLLYTHLLQDVQVISYNPGHLILHVLPEVSRHFPLTLKNFLENATKREWKIEISPQEGLPSLKKQQEIAMQEQIENCKNHPLVKKALELFPESVIQNVTLSASV
jgi:DNA polymerase-3 subunit gamma/tau